MPNLQQNNQIEHINKEINLLQDLLKKKRKKSKSISKWVNENRRIQVKQGQMTNLSQTKKIQNVVKNIFQNKIKQIKKNTKLLQNILTQVKKRNYLKND